MFDSFKKKLSAAISTISDKIAGKKSPEEEVKKEDLAQKIEKKEEPVQKIEKIAPAKQHVSKPAKSEKSIKSAEAPKQKPHAEEKPEKAKSIEPELPATQPEIVHEELEKVSEEIEIKREEPKTEEKKGFFSRITGAITETRISVESLDSALWDIEMALLENNVASDVASKICSDIKQKLAGKSVKRSAVEKIIKDSVLESVRYELDQKPVDIEAAIKAARKEKRPCVIMFVGFNGSGKTTNIAKLGSYLKSKEYTCVFAAADSFRVAAIEQLEEHGRRLGIPVIKHKYGADPAAVIFDAVAHAKAKGIDVVLADTAGRVHTDSNLIGELKKIVRVNAPDLKFLVVEAIAGNDVIEQAKVFDEVGLDGVILSKWDIDDKGGASLSVTHTLKKPIVFLGTGQNYEDFEKFDLKKVMESVI
ncbi:MAG: signal recognition particle-docking protein FtsY [Nanoarchaeota archaeon]|nr:signal recognition particle-docking protein FtsY [Nanoarchaeota archaeon]MBU4452073.1 signal recognition particle-docking protein FtsY [Nanoarchaeota archaeon]MCG2724454.1 signal recognition particle-docking protein FtsY [archaeon]